MHQTCIKQRMPNCGCVHLSTVAAYIEQLNAQQPRHVMQIAASTCHVTLPMQHACYIVCRMLTESTQAGKHRSNARFQSLNGSAVSLGPARVSDLSIKSSSIPAQFRSQLCLTPLTPARQPSLCSLLPLLPCTAPHYHLLDAQPPYVGHLLALSLHARSSKLC
jgi:hypothetical protein